MKHKYTKVFFIIAIITLIACSGEKKEDEKAIRPVIYQEVGYQGQKKIRTFSGKSQTEKVINLSFRSKGIMIEQNMKLGQKIKKGQLLAKLDNVQARLSYESAVSSLQSAKSQKNTAKSSLDRVRSLYEKGSTSLSDYEAVKNTYKTASSNYESTKRSVSIQKEQIRYGYLYAPENGVISAVNAEIDENISLGQSIGVLNAGTTMEISLGIPESVINKIIQNMEVNVEFTALKNQKFTGKVTEVSPAVDINTSTYPVSITISHPTVDIKSGMAAQVTFNFGDENVTSNILVVPAKAIGEDGNGNFVFLIEEGKDGSTKVKKQAVTIGTLTSEGFEIKEGLQAGQKIATAGLQTLLDGQEVKLK